MDKSTIEKYKAEMLGMYRSSKNPGQHTAYVSQDIALPAASENTNADSIPDSTGKLIVIVTTVRSLYPLENAEVSVFSGDYQNRQIIARDFTDQSGRTEPFILETPGKSLSLDSDNTKLPYAVYGIEIKAEGYVDMVFLNVPVFSGVTSLQKANMTLIETAGKDKGPIFIDSAQQYNLNGE